mgnify:CR=1 FL=1
MQRNQDQVYIMLKAFAFQGFSHKLGLSPSGHFRSLGKQSQNVNFMLKGVYIH